MGTLPCVKKQAVQMQVIQWAMYGSYFKFGLEPPCICQEFLVKSDFENIISRTGVVFVVKSKSHSITVC